MQKQLLNASSEWLRLETNLSSPTELLLLLDDIEAGKNLPQYYLYTDGSSSHITREGGWAYIILSEDGFETQDFGYVTDTTNNGMELRAAIEGLKYMNKYNESYIHLYSDSAYVINTLANSWWKEWLSRGWRSMSGEPTPNTTLWTELISLYETHVVNLVKIRGHSGDKMNDYCDKLAKAARKNQGEVTIEEFEL